MISTGYNLRSRTVGKGTVEGVVGLGSYGLKATFEAFRKECESLSIPTKYYGSL